jgi:hypothetical protein
MCDLTVQEANRRKMIRKKEEEDEFYRTLSYLFLFAA